LGVKPSSPEDRFLLEFCVVEPTTVDEPEVKAYVIRPPVINGTRYRAPRLSRSAFVGLDREPAPFWRLWTGQPILPADDGLPDGNRVSELRYGVMPGVSVAAITSSVRVSSGSTVRSFLWVGLVGALIAAFIHSDRSPSEQSVTQAPQASLSATQQLIAQNLAVKATELRRAQVSLERGERRGVVVYTVASGDSFAAVGQRFDLGARSVRVYNGLPRGYRLRIGQQLLIPPVDGLVHKVSAPIASDKLAKRYRVSVEKLREYNEALPAMLKPAERVFIPGARELLEQSTPKIERGYREESRGPWAGRLRVSRSLVGQFGNRVGTLSWPAGGQFSSPFGIRGFAFHPGIDISNDVGTAIRAAKVGTVVAAGWMGAYGYAVDIEHGPGVVTRYAHCSSLLVAAGDHVTGGQVIAKMGNTGRSTGPHLHFEVRIQGRAVNPSNFL
jgi:murein DD-endopeptidase MepM/ murein hydrolase activator NlpD